jgi:predicted small secreted protein
MIKLLIIATIAILFCSCEINVGTSNTKFDKVGSIFLDDLYHRRTKSCIEEMDQRFISLAKDKGINLDSIMNVLADKLHNDFKGQISSTLVFNKDTVFENTQSTYLKYQVSSSQHTGYYNFYVNNNDGKIILISQNL